MEKYTQKEIRSFVKNGIAVDITHHGNPERNELEAREGWLEKVGYIYGINAGLLKGHNSGTLYAITKRSTAIFIYF